MKLPGGRLYSSPKHYSKRLSVSNLHETKTSTPQPGDRKTPIVSGLSPQVGYSAATNGLLTAEDAREAFLSSVLVVTGDPGDPGDRLETGRAGCCPD